MEPAMQYFLRWAAVIISQQCCDLEWRHGRNRGRTNQHGHSRWDAFCARAVNAEAVHLHRAKAPAAPVDPPLPQQVDTVLAGGRKLFKRAPSARQLHFQDWLKCERSLGRSGNPARPGAWAASVLAHDSLGPEARALYEQRCEMAKARTLAENTTIKRRRKLAVAVPSSSLGLAGVHPGSEDVEAESQEQAEPGAALVPYAPPPEPFLQPPDRAAVCPVPR